MIAALHGRPGRAVGPTEAQGEDAVDEAVATETASRSWALRVFDTVMRESRGDFKSYLRSEPPIFREMVNRLTLSISKHQDCRHLPASARKPHWLRTISIEILRRLRGDCTEIARFPYNPRAASASFQWKSYGARSVQRLYGDTVTAVLMLRNSESQSVHHLPEYEWLASEV